MIGLDDRVDILRAPLADDPYSTEGRRDWAAATVVAAGVPASVQPQTSTEETRDRQAVTSAWRVFLPPGTDVQATDRIAVPGGLVLEVDGRPGAWRYAGAEDHIEAVCQHVEG